LRNVTSEENTLSTEENKNVVRKFFEAGNAGDMDTVMALIADDVVWTDIGTTSLSGTYRGKAELGERLLGPLFAQLKAGITMRIHRLVAEDDFVVAQTSGSAETLEGVPYDNTYCWIIRIRDGQFAEVTEFLDTELVTRVFG
jgi:ketosteroid isomerase-like protein